MSEETLTLGQMTSGAYLLESGRHYVLEPGMPISIESGNTVITIAYNSVAAMTEVEVEGLDCHFEQTVYDDADEDEDPEPDSYSYCAPEPITALDEHMTLHRF